MGLPEPSWASWDNLDPEAFAFPNLGNADSSLFSFSFSIFKGQGSHKVGLGYGQYLLTLERRLVLPTAKISRFKLT